MKKTARQSNIELLRIITIIGVIILHYNNPGIGGAFIYASGNNANLCFLYFIESVFICAVDLFMIISGYFLCMNNKRNIWKVIELFVQVILFSFMTYLAKGMLSHEPISAKGALNALLPNNYFVVLYCTVFIFSPFINVLIDSISIKSFDALMIIVFCMFLVYPTTVDLLSETINKEIIGLSSIGMYGSQWGYTFINFASMYLVGAYLRKRNSRFETLKKWQLVLIILSCAIIMMIWSFVNDRIGFFTEKSAWEYCNPLVVIEASAIFLLFSKINIGVNKIINILSEAVFTVYLFHNIILRKTNIEYFASGNTLLLFLHILIVCISIYLLCWIIHNIYHFASDWIIKYFANKINLTFIYTKRIEEKTSE